MGAWPLGSLSEQWEQEKMLPQAGLRHAQGSEASCCLDDGDAQGFRAVRTCCPRLPRILSADGSQKLLLGVVTLFSMPGAGL